MKHTFKNEGSSESFFEEISRILACPNCKKDFVLYDFRDVICPNCCELYRRLTYTWEFIPSSWKATSHLWSVWKHLQENGLVSYRKDPEHNLGVGDRQDCIEFSRFCRFYGRVLDIGCGPQAWPAYFTYHSDNTRFVGVDPLVGEAPARYLQFRSLGEFLPFKNHIFDHIVFATSLDHFIDPIPVFKEAMRVCRQDGEINIWIGEKNKDAPEPDVVQDWYANLKKPAESEDFFHLKRVSFFDLKKIINHLNLSIAQNETFKTDKYRTSFFLKIKKESKT